MNCSHSNASVHAHGCAEITERSREPRYSSKEYLTREESGYLHILIGKFLNVFKEQ